MQIEGERAGEKRRYKITVTRSQWKVAKKDEERKRDSATETVNNEKLPNQKQLKYKFTREVIQKWILREDIERFKNKQTL